MSDLKIRFEQCPLCGSSEFSQYLSQDCTMHPLYHRALPPHLCWCQCDVCGHEFTDSYFTETALSLVFSQTNEAQAVGQNLEHKRFIASRMVDRVVGYLTQGRWLDVGFGDGSLLMTAREYGFHPIGLDLRSGNVESLKSLGIEAYCERIESFRPDEAIDIVSFMDVVEHVPDPQLVIEKARDILREDGLLFISMPNRETHLWDEMTKQKVNPYYAEIEHYHNFTRSGLYSLLREVGFDPVSYGVSQRYKCGMEVLARKAS